MIEVVGCLIGFSVLLSPVYFKLFKIENRLTKIEAVLNGDKE